MTLLTLTRHITKILFSLTLQFLIYVNIYTHTPVYCDGMMVTYICDTAEC